MKYKIYSDEIYLENQVYDGYILTDNKVIKDVTKSYNDSDSKEINLKGLKVMPGFLDIHVHGGNGFDTMDTNYKAINEISKFKIKEGVTSFCPTTVTTTPDIMKKALECVNDSKIKGVDGAKIIGVFLEGPFINTKFKGAHDEELILPIDLELLKELVETGDGILTSIAIAPELENALEAIEYLTDRGIDVRVGHSGATAEETFVAIDKGANIGIHTYNAMSSLSHRDSGIVGAVLTRDDIYNELICDMVHVEKPAIDVLYRCKKDKMILVTDCMRAGGLEDGFYKLGSLDVRVENGEARLKSDSSLAGSTLDIITAVKNMHHIIGVPINEIVKMVTKNPAEALGIYEQVGSIAKDKRADIVAIDKDFVVKFVMVDGEILLDNTK